MINIVFDENNKLKLEEKIFELNFNRLDGGLEEPIIKLSSITPIKELVDKYDGKDITVYIVGYGRDDNYEAFSAMLYPTDSFTSRFESPKILISKSTRKTYKGASINSLKFWPLMEPFVIDGKLEITAKDETGKRGKQ